MVPGSDATVLVVEPDSATSTCILQCISASFGNRYRVVAVPTRQEGYDQLTTLHPHLLVMETDLPDGEGTWLIRSARSELSPSPAIIVCSHLRGVRDKIAAFEAGADDYVVKPLNSEQLTLRFQLLERFASLVSARSFDRIS
jgi:two-component system KDP operon response regulator KdpE